MPFCRALALCLAVALLPLTAPAAGAAVAGAPAAARTAATPGTDPASDAAQAADCVSLTPYAGQPLEAFEPQTSLQQQQTVKIGAIRVVSLPVFDLTDPDQDVWVYRLANDVRDKLHLNTRRWVIAGDLLFKPGDEVVARTLAESERLLRRRTYLYDARVLPARRCGDTVDVDVVTRDVWTLSPRLDVSRSGGTSNLGIGISDVNFLGTGKYLSTGYRKTVDREGIDISVFDPNVLGTHDTLGIGLAKTKDGYRRSFGVEQPFYALDSRVSWGASISRTKLNEKLYFRGDDFAQYRHVASSDSVFAGWSRGLIDGKQVRWRVGYAWQDDHFELDPRRPPPPRLAQDRSVAYPFVSVESVQDDFHAARNLNRIQRHEDLYLGQRYVFQLGYSTKGNDRVLLSGQYSDGYRFGADERTLVLYDASVTGAWRTDIDRGENIEVDANIRLRDRQSRRFAFYAAIGGSWTGHLTPDNQLLLGGDTGLRGYPLRYQVGSRRFLVSLEERYFSDLYVAKLLRVGAAVFVDVGRAWFPGNPSRNEFGVLGDIGIGLRLESTRTQSGNLVHIDLAFPVVDGQRVKGLQLLLNVKQSL